MCSKNRKKAKVCGGVGDDQPVTNHLFLFGSDMNMHPEYIRKEDSRYFVRCINQHNNCGACDTLGSETFYSTILFPQNRGNLNRS